MKTTMTFPQYRRYLLGILVSLLTAAAFAEPSPFRSNSLDQIEERYAGQSFLLVIWEINCVPCREELGMLGRKRERQPDMNLVLVSTDSIDMQEKADEILDENLLSGVDAWMFADANVERLRYAIDPEWFGELPRNYIYDSDSSRVGFSGKLSEEILNEWLSLQARQAEKEHEAEHSHRIHAVEGPAGHTGAIDPPAGLDEVERHATPFSTGTEGLPEAVETEIVSLSDGDIYEVTASYVKKNVGGRTLRMLAYNGSIPGPLIQAPLGSEIRIIFKNETDVEQTIHSHGVRVDNLSDGVPGLTQESVQPGEIYTYTIKFNDAGVFWYHPHTREDYGQELGLYGNYIIDPAEPGYWNPVNREIPIIIDDALIEDGRIAPFYREFTNFALLGRFGNEFLVNGRKDFTLELKQGEVVRFFVTNVSNARTYNLSLPNALLKLVGTDLGKYEHEAFTDSLLISPGERVIVEAYFKHPGRYHLTHTQPDGQVHLAIMAVSGDERVQTSHAEAFLSLRHNDVTGEDADNLRAYLDAEPDKELLLTIDLENREVDHSMHAHASAGEAQQAAGEGWHDHAGHAESAMPPPDQFQPLSPTAEALKQLQWSDPGQSDRTHRTPGIAWKLTDTATGKSGGEIDDWTFRQGELVKISIKNDERADHVMQHPIHFHGQRFVVLSTDGLPNNNLAWKDTVLVFPGQTVDVLVEMGNTGEWMAHCHISEHLHAGMSLTFRVENEDGYAAGDEFRAELPGVHHHH